MNRRAFFGSAVALTSVVGVGWSQEQAPGGRQAQGEGDAGRLYNPNVVQQRVRSTDADNAIWTSIPAALPTSPVLLLPRYTAKFLRSMKRGSTPRAFWRISWIAMVRMSSWRPSLKDSTWRATWFRGS